MVSTMLTGQPCSLDLRTARVSWPQARACLLLTFLFLATAAFSVQEKGGRSGVSSAPKPPADSGRVGGPHSNPGKTRKSVALADLIVSFPVDCQIWLEGKEISFQDLGKSLILKGQKIRIESTTDGTLKFTGLKPDSYTITAAKLKHRAFKETVVVALGQQNSVSVVLVPESAHLTVSTSIANTLIEVINLDTNVRSGPYTTPLDSAEFSPGRYRVNVSKEGYKPASREIVIRPTESVYLEPLLEPLPTPTPIPTSGPTAGAAVPLSAKVETVADDLFVRLFGASGDSQTTGTVNVTITGRSIVNVSGMLNGLPCLVQFVQLENVAHGSLVEMPGPSNQWTLLGIRVRPKNWKRPIRFAINWQSLPPSSASNSPVSDFVVPAEAIKKVVPEFPDDARRIRVTGTVTVSCLVDRFGNVVTAKAVDGPYVFRRTAEETARKWKFRPETRNGNSVESTVTIRFAFENQ